MTRMLIKCETRSSRVKGVCFHSTLQWALAALHTGTIQLWDYRIGALVDKFEEHEGPVRGVCFHPTQPLFVSGGDDYKVKLWSLTTRRCIYTFLGHLDYIRTSVFHNTYPWILTASDDQTVRLWNWQSRQCIGVLTGHTHYVMSAVFHPTEDFILSASLDQTVRVWDTSGLRERAGGVSCNSLVSSARSEENIVAAAAAAAAAAKGKGSFAQKDLFSPTDVICKFVLEGHERGVNWAVFHPTTQLIASAGDDRLIKLWRYNSTKAWEVDTLRGHTNNVSSITFSKSGEFLISNSEDRSVKVWDTSRRVCIYTYTRENDRFWIAAISNNTSNVVCGHDSGMIIFKLASERPAMGILPMKGVLYVKKDTRTLMLRDYVSECSNGQLQETPISETKKPSTMWGDAAKKLVVNNYNPNEINALVFYDGSDGATFDLVCAPLPTSGVSGHAKISQGCGVAACFVSRNRFAVLDRPGSPSVRVMDLGNTLVKTIDIGCPIDLLYSIRQTTLLIIHEDKIRLYDLPTRVLSPELHISIGNPIRSVKISADGNRIALLGKHVLLLLRVVWSQDGENKAPPFEVITCEHENIRVKGGAWDENTGGFVYSTLSHVKYCLPDGDCGILFSLQHPVYLISVENQHVFYMDRKTCVVAHPIGSAEYVLKQTLADNKMDQVALLVRRGNLCGNALISYLKNKGHSEIALEFLPDKNSQFLMALQIGRLSEALEAAMEINKKSAWRLLLEVGSMYGDFGIMEFCYKRLKMYSSLLILYFVLGNHGKLEKMFNICNILGNNKLKYINSLYIHDVEKRIDVLNSTNNFSLAHLVHTVFSTTIQANSEEPGQAISTNSTTPDNGFVKEHDVDEFIPAMPDALTPPIPIQRFPKGDGCAWPRASGTASSRFAEVLQQVDNMRADVADQMLLQASLADPNPIADMPMASGSIESFGMIDGGADDWSDGIDLPVDQTPAKSESVDVHLADAAKSVHAYAIAPGSGPEKEWMATSNNPLPSDLVAAGDFSGALNMLRLRLGLIDVTPLHPIFQRIYQATWMQTSGLPLAPALSVPLFASQGGNKRPYKYVNTAMLLDDLKEAHKLVTGAKFTEGLHAFRHILQHLCLAVADDKEEETQLIEILELCTTYVVAMSLETARSQLDESDIKRNIELVAYFACCKLQPAHAFLVIRRAMSVSWKAQNFLTTAAFARRLMTGNFTSIKGAAEEIAKARKVLALAEQKARDAYPINFEPSEADSLLLCTTTLSRVQPGTPVLSCSFCGSKSKSEYQGNLCSVCCMGEIGARVVGLHFRRNF